MQSEKLNHHGDTEARRKNYNCFFSLFPLCPSCLSCEKLLCYFNLPTTRTTKLSGRTVRRGRGLSAVGAGGGPNFAVTRKTLWVFESSAIVRASLLRRNIFRHAEFVRRLLAHHGQNAFAARRESQSGFVVECGRVYAFTDRGRSQNLAGIGIHHRIICHSPRTDVDSSCPWRVRWFLAGSSGHDCLTRSLLGSMRSARSYLQC